MHKINKIILSSILFLTAIIPTYVSADSYRVISIKGCTATLNDTIVREGTIVPENAKIKIEKINRSSSWIIKLQSTSTGKIHPLCSPSSTTSKTSNSNSESWVSWFWNSIIGQKKCSTRAPENELTDGLANNLSQTFYLFCQDDSDLNDSIDFATNLSDSTLLRCSYQWDNRSYMFDIPIINGIFSLSSKYFKINSSEERTILKIEVKCILENGEFVPITDSMNVILINELLI